MKKPPDERFMSLALREAKEAAAAGEVPVGAIAVSPRGEILARAHNLRETSGDPLGHAELILLKKLSRKMRSWRALGITLYVTLEPCIMCMGALLQARIARVVFGAADPKAGACGSLYNLATDRRLNHRIEVASGLLAGECAKILQGFFKRLRARARRHRKGVS